MPVKRWINLREQFFDTQGNPLNGGKLFFYTAGSSAKLNTYNSSSGVTPNSNPLILDAFGRLQAEVWLTSGSMYKAILTTSADSDPPVSPIWSEDNISGVNDAAAVALDQWTAGPTPTYVSATSFTLVGDQTTIFEKGRRLKLVDSGGTKYGTIDSAVFAAVTTVTLKESVLATPVTAVYYGILSTTNSSVPNDNITQTVASATTTNLDTSVSHSVIISGTTAITGIALGDGQLRFVEFSGALTLTNGASLILPGGANITTAAGDSAVFRGEASGVVRCLSYTKAVYPPSTGKQPTSQTFTSGTGATYTTPTGALRLRVRMVGGGGGGSAATTNNGATGTATTFSTFTASAGIGGTAGGSNGGAGGAAAGGSITNIPGGAGQGGATSATGGVFMPGGQGGSSHFGGAGPGGAGNNSPSIGAATNSGGGGGGAGGVGASSSGSGGGSGGYVESIITVPAATYTYTVGPGGNGGTAGGIAGGNGAAGIIIVEEFYS